jgi:hypothetical protein
VIFRRPTAFLEVSKLFQRCAAVVVTVALSNEERRSTFFAKLIRVISSAKGKVALDTNRAKRVWRKVQARSAKQAVSPNGSDAIGLLLVESMRVVYQSTPPSTDS